MTGEHTFKQAYIQCKLTYPSIQSFLEDYNHQIRHGTLNLALAQVLPKDTRFRLLLELPFMEKPLNLDALVLEGQHGTFLRLAFRDQQSPQFRLLGYYVQLCVALDPRQQVHSSTAVFQEQEDKTPVILRFLNETVSLDTQPTHQFEFTTPEHFLTVHEHQLSKGHLTATVTEAQELPALGANLRVLIHPPFHWFHTTLDAEVVSHSPDAVHFAISVRTKRSRDIIEQYVELCQAVQQAMLHPPAEIEAPQVSEIRLEKEFDLEFESRSSHPTKRVTPAAVPSQQKAATPQSESSQARSPFRTTSRPPEAGKRDVVVSHHSSNRIHGDRLERLKRRQTQNQKPKRSISQEVVGAGVRGASRGNQERLARLRQKAVGRQTGESRPPQPSTFGRKTEHSGGSTASSSYHATSDFSSTTSEIKKPKPASSETPTESLSRPDLPAVEGNVFPTGNMRIQPQKMQPRESTPHFGSPKELIQDSLRKAKTDSNAFAPIGLDEEKAGESSEESGQSVFEQNQNRLRRLARNRRPTNNDKTVPLTGHYQRSPMRDTSPVPPVPELSLQKEAPEITFEEIPSLSSTPETPPVEEELSEEVVEQLGGSFALFQSKTSPQTKAVKHIELTTPTEEINDSMKPDLEESPSSGSQPALSGTPVKQEHKTPTIPVSNRERLERLRQTQPTNKRLADRAYGAPLVASVEVGDLYYHRISFPNVRSFLQEYERTLRFGQAWMQISPPPRPDDVLIVALRPPHLGEDYQFRARVLELTNDNGVQLELMTEEGNLLDKLHRYAHLCAAILDIQEGTEEVLEDHMAYASELDWNEIIRLKASDVSEDVTIQVQFPSLRSYLHEYTTNILCDGLFVRWDDAPDVGGTVHLLLRPPHSWHSVVFKARLLVSSGSGIGLSLETTNDAEKHVLQEYEKLVQSVQDDLLKKSKTTQASFDSIPAAQTVSSGVITAEFEPAEVEPAESQTKEQTAPEQPAVPQRETMPSAAQLPTVPDVPVNQVDSVEKPSSSVSQPSMVNVSETDLPSKDKAHTLERLPSLEERMALHKAAEAVGLESEPPKQTKSSPPKPKAVEHKTNPVSSGASIATMRAEAPPSAIDHSLRVIPEGVVPQMEGTLERIDVADLLISMAEQEQHGLLELTLQDNTVQIFFQRGVVAHIFQANAIYGTRFRNILEKDKKLTAEQIDEAEWVQREQSVLIGEALVQLGYLSMRELGLLLRKQTREKLLAVLEMRRGKFRFFPHLQPDNAKPMPTLQPLKMLFRHFARSEQLNQRTTQEIERLMANHMDEYVLPMKTSPEEIYLFGFSDREQEIWEQLIDGSHTLRNILVLSRLTTAQTHAFVFAMQKLRYLAFREELPQELRSEQNDSLLFEKSRQVGTNYFDFLELHWTSREAEVKEAYHRLKETYDGFISEASSDEAHKMHEQIVEYLEQAYKVLVKQKTRREYRIKVVSPSQVEFMSQLLIQQGDMAIFRRDLPEATERYKHSLELAPERKDIERKVLMLQSAIRDGVVDIIVQKDVDLGLS
jgi:hypothetical protein